MYSTFMYHLSSFTGADWGSEHGDGVFTVNGIQQVYYGHYLILIVLVVFLFLLAFFGGVVFSFSNEIDC